MRILIDLQGAQTGSRLRGIGRYCLSLAQAIARNGKDHEVLIALNANFPETIAPLLAGLRSLVPPENIYTWQAPYRVWESEPDNRWRQKAAELVRESFFASLRPDVIHVGSLFEGFDDSAVTSVGRFDRDTPVVITQHDLIPLLYPAEYLDKNPRYGMYYREKLKQLRRADGWVANSDFTAREAEQHLELAPGTVVGISAACDTIFRKMDVTREAERALRHRFHLDKPFVMYTGGSDPRKNLDRLVRAWGMLSDGVRKSHRLLLVGSMPEGDVAALRRVEAADMPGQSNLVFTGYVADRDLVTLYSLCKLFVFPSLHEGFGLPVLEAMSCGAPVICSNAASVPEVVGVSRGLFNPESLEDIAAKLSYFLAHPAARAELADQGLRRAAHFSWDATAQAALDAFGRVAESRSAILSWPENLDELERQESRLIAAIAAVSSGHPRPSDADLVEVSNAIAANRALSEQALRRATLPKRLSWRVEGPFDSSYSLALLNRETARALKEYGHDVALHSTEGGGDYTPVASFLAANHDIQDMHVNATTLPQEQADVTSRNLYPPRVDDMRCRVNLLHHYAWEESGFPLEWVDDFNDSLQGITCLSTHVRKVLVDHGVTVPLAVSGCGADHWQRIIAERNFIAGGRSFRFLHVSSCFPRKGIDVLLKAYGKAFSASDDVSLVIKTFPNPHNEIDKWLAEAKDQRADFPDVLIIESDLTDEQLKALYEQCDVLVAPSRAEGFGLPIAEAMLSNIPAITTAWGGQLDYCSPDTSWLVDYDFTAAQSHFNLYESVWAEPKVGDLARVMREAFQAAPEQRTERATRGRNLLLNEFRWTHVTGRLEAAARTWARQSAKLPPRIAWITTWNTRCGIATYSSHLVEQIADPVIVLAARADATTGRDDGSVVRCWDAGDSDPLIVLRHEIERRSIDTLVVQFNYGFFQFDRFAAFLHAQIDAGRTVVVFLHATEDPVHAPHKQLSMLRDALARCARVLVHSIADLNRLKALRLVGNVALFPHGILDYLPTPRHRAAARLVIASYGFFLPHKGLLELIDALAVLRTQGHDVELHMVNAEYPIPESVQLIDEARRRIAMHRLERHVRLSTDFLDDRDSLALLADADLIVFPYRTTAESASGAVRYGLATGVPVAVTPIAIFSDVQPAVFRLPGESPAEIAAGIASLLTEIAINSPAVQDKRAEADRWREAHRYARLGRRLSGMLTALRNEAVAQR